MRVKILVCDPIDVEGVQKLRDEGFKVDTKPSIDKEELKKIIPEYDAIVVRSRTKVSKEIIECGKRLRAIGRAGAGLDNIDLKAAEEDRVTVLNSPEALADSVAELTIGLILALARKITLANRSMKDGKWIKRELRGSLLKRKTLGLIGLGNIGMRVAEIAKAIGMNILITKRTPPPEELLGALDAELVPLEELLRRSDVVSIHVPLTEETDRMIGAREVSVMKPGAFLVNTSRGRIVDGNVLLDALRSGELGGAALDVYECEPPENLELVRLPNVLCTPHIGAQTYEAQKAASVMIAEKLIQFFRDYMT